MSHLRLAAWLSGVTLAFLLAACAPSPDASSPARVRFASGTPGGGFYTFGMELAAEYRRIQPRLGVEARQSDGAASNIQALQRGEADIALAHADVAYLAFAGRLDDQSGPFDRLRGMALLQLMQVHVVVRKDSDIRRMSDLRGRHVSIGRPSRGGASTAGLVLRAFGIGLNDIRLEPLRYDEAGERLSRGALDALIVTGTYPLAAVTAATRGGARLLPLDGPAIDRLRLDYPFFRRTSIPPGTYAGQGRSLRTIGVEALLVCRADLDEGLVHDLTAGLFEVLPRLPSLRWSIGLMDLEQAPATPIPLHEGAARYYRERELAR